MFTIPGHEQFMTTIGKLNFFRWALESKILDYMEAHEEEIRSGYNSYLKETTLTQKKNKSELNKSESNTSDSSEQEGSKPALQHAPQKAEVRTTRRRTKQMPSSLTKLQVYTTPVELDFS
jgi:hypothetical protein